MIHGQKNRHRRRSRYEGLPEGELLVSARDLSGASAILGPVRLRAGAPARAPGSDASDHRLAPVPAGSSRSQTTSERGEVLSEELELGATPEREMRLRFLREPGR